MNQTAIKQEIVYTNEDRVKCEGNGDENGHPKIYLQFKKVQNPQKLVCPYCSRIFIKETV